MSIFIFLSRDRDTNLTDREEMKRNSQCLFSQIQTPNKKRRSVTTLSSKSPDYLEKVEAFAQSVEKVRADFNKLREPVVEKPSEHIKTNYLKYGIVLQEGPHKGRPIVAEFNPDGTRVKDSVRFVKESPLITPIPRSPKQKIRPLILKVEKPLVFSKISTPLNPQTEWISMSKKITISCK